MTNHSSQVIHKNKDRPTHLHTIQIKNMKIILVLKGIYNIHNFEYKYIKYKSTL